MVASLPAVPLAMRVHRSETWVQCLAWRGLLGSGPLLDSRVRCFSSHVERVPTDQGRGPEWSTFSTFEPS